MSDSSSRGRNEMPRPDMTTLVRGFCGVQLDIGCPLTPGRINIRMSPPYLYCNGNPIWFIDPDGRDIYTFDSDGNFTGNIIKQDGEHMDVFYCPKKDIWISHLTTNPM